MFLCLGDKLPVSRICTVLCFPDELKYQVHLRLFLSCPVISHYERSSVLFDLLERIKQDHRTANDA